MTVFDPSQLSDSSHLPSTDPPEDWGPSPESAVPLVTSHPTTLQKVHPESSVLHLINGEHYSGAERVQDLLSLRLPELGFRVGLACLKQGQFAAKRHNRDAPLFQIPMSGKLDLSAATRLAKLVRTQGYDLLHAHTPRTVMLGAMVSKLARIPLIYHVHSPVGRDSTRAFHNWMNKIVERVSIGAVHELITVSHSLAAYMTSLGVSQRRITVVPNGVPAPERRRSELPPGGVWTLGTIALFRPRKGTEVLLESLARARSHGLDVRLNAVGSFETTEYENQLKSLTRRLKLEPFVHWTGFTSDVPAELCKMDVMVLPSLFGEGLPMVVLESMAAGVPVIASDVEGVPEAIRSGQDGMIVKAGDVDDLAKAIGRIAAGKISWSALRESAMERHARQFSDRAMATGVALSYVRVLDR